MSGGATTYGPGAFYYVGTILYLGLAVGYFVLFGYTLHPGMIAFVLIFGFCGFAVFAGWARYRLDDEGIQIRTLSTHRGYRWGAIGGVHGTEVAPHHQGRGMTQVTRHVVHDGGGRRLFRISPWTANRHALVREIRERTAATRRSVLR